MKLKDLRESSDSSIYHRFGVTLSDPNHPLVSKRTETVYKTIRVKGDKDSAMKKAQEHYKNKGYKVHGIEHLGSTN